MAAESLVSPVFFLNANPKTQIFCDCIEQTFHNSLGKPGSLEVVVFDDLRPVLSYLRKVEIEEIRGMPGLSGQEQVWYSDCYCTCHNWPAD